MFSPCRVRHRQPLHRQLPPLLRPRQNRHRQLKADEPKAAPAAAAAVEGTSLLAPMPGMIISFEKNVGDEINEGETAVILEAMKMENALPAPVSGTVKAINFSSGDSVAKGDVLCVIG